MEREQEDLLIIGHASVIRCLLAYLIGLPASEVPAVEIARGDLVEVVPASYGVHSQAFHFWSGPGRKHSDGDDNSGNGPNFYENYAEATAGKGKNATAGTAVPTSPISPTSPTQEQGSSPTNALGVDTGPVISVTEPSPI